MRVWRSVGSMVVILLIACVAIGHGAADSPAGSAIIADLQCRGEMLVTRTDGTKLAAYVGLQLMPADSVTASEAGTVTLFDGADTTTQDVLPGTPFVLGAAAPVKGTGLLAGLRSSLGDLFGRRDPSAKRDQEVGAVQAQTVIARLAVPSRRKKEAGARQAGAPDGIDDSGGNLQMGKDGRAAQGPDLGPETALQTADTAGRTEAESDPELRGDAERAPAPSAAPQSAPMADAAAAPAPQVPKERVSAQNALAPSAAAQNFQGPGGPAQGTVSQDLTFSQPPPPPTVDAASRPEPEPKEKAPPVGKTLDSSRPREPGGPRMGTNSVSAPPGPHGYSAGPASGSDPAKPAPRASPAATPGASAETPARPLPAEVDKLGSLPPAAFAAQLYNLREDHPLARARFVGTSGRVPAPASAPVAGSSSWRSGNAPVTTLSQKLSGGSKVTVTVTPAGGAEWGIDFEIAPGAEWRGVLEKVRKLIASGMPNKELLAANLFDAHRFVLMGYRQRLLAAQELEKAGRTGAVMRGVYSGIAQQALELGDFDRYKHALSKLKK